MHYGEEADNLAADAPEHYARGFKMKLGSGAPALMCFRKGALLHLYGQAAYCSFLETRQKVLREARMLRLRGCCGHYQPGQLHPGPGGGFAFGGRGGGLPGGHLGHGT